MAFGVASRLPGEVSAHANVAEMERARVLGDARTAIEAAVLPITSIPAPHGSHGQFFSETEPSLSTAGAAAAPKLFRAHAHALQGFSANVACLSAAYLLTKDEAYAAKAGEQVQAWLLASETRLQTNFDLAGCTVGTMTATPAGIVDLVPLAELARAVTFLVDSEAFTPAMLQAIHMWFAEVLVWMNDNRAAFIARESKDHRASAWLLIAAALARFNIDDKALEACRHRFRSPTLRNQIRSDGVFPQEVATPNPYRNTLMNFDLLAGACQLLASPFDLLWDYELIDDVGIREVAAYLYPVIAHPERWGFVADAHFFRDLPGRRPGLLFAGRPYSRPEYVELWQSLPPQPALTVAESFPIRQPLLWTARATHGL